jgi:hypothetical protein
MADDYVLLGLGELTSIVTAITISAWGSQVLLECIYDPTGDRLPYQLLFKNCREVRFEVHDLEEIGQCDADLIGISLGKNNHQKPAVIHTDIFEISLLYEKVELGIGMNKIRDFVPLISDIPLVNVSGT